MVGGSVPALPHSSSCQLLVGVGVCLGLRRNPLDGGGKEFRFVELHGLRADLALVVVVPGLGLDIHPVALLQLGRVLAQVAENDDVLPVGAGLPLARVVGSVRRHCY